MSYGHKALSYGHKALSYEHKALSYPSDVMSKVTLKNCALRGFESIEVLINVIKDGRKLEYLHGMVKPATFAMCFS